MPSKKKIIKTKWDWFTLYDLEGDIENAICFLEKLKNKGKIVLEIEEDNEFNYAMMIVYLLREETDKEYEKRLIKEEKQKERKLQEDKFKEERERVRQIKSVLREAKKLGLKVIE